MPVKGKLTFNSPDRVLNNGFEWAKRQALQYVFEGDPAGDWYEAALPGRQAFCMRDVAHQAVGAHALGLAPHNKNMLRKFAQAIAESRDFCGFWEINREYRPAPADYKNDGDFWYNLPANFDILDACLRMYRWTGDEEYVKGIDFNHFYTLTTDDYVKQWDADGDGIPERARPGSRRGIPSYDEGRETAGASLMLDLIAIQARGYDSYAALCAHKGDPERAESYAKKAEALRRVISREWWDSAASGFFTAKLRDGGLARPNAGGILGMALYYGGVADEAQLSLSLEQLNNIDPSELNVETMSYYPALFFENGRDRAGYAWLCRLLDPALKRREYPEVSFTAIGCYVENLMGIRPDARTNQIITSPHLLPEHEWAELLHCPVFGGSIGLRYEKGRAAFTNHTGRTVLWNSLQVENGQTARQTL